MFLKMFIYSVFSYTYSQSQNLGSQMVISLKMDSRFKGDSRNEH